MLILNLINKQICKYNIKHLNKNQLCYLIIVLILLKIKFWSFCFSKFFSKFLLDISFY